MLQLWEVYSRQIDMDFHSQMWHGMELARVASAVLAETLRLAEGLQVSVDLVEDLVNLVEDRAKTWVVVLVEVWKVGRHLDPVVLLVEALVTQVEVDGLGGGGDRGSGPGGSPGVTSPSPSSGWDGGKGGFGEGFNGRAAWDSFQDVVTAYLRAGREMMDKLAVRVDKLESAPDGEDTVVLGGNVLRCKKDVQALLETHLGVNCDVPAGAFASLQFLLNEVMLTLGCTMPTLDDLLKLKHLDVRAINLRCTQALMATLPVFLTSGRLSTYLYKGSGSGSAQFKTFPSFADWGIKSDEDKLQYKCFRALEEVCNALEDHIRDTLGNSAQMQLIAMNLLSKCKKVVIEIFNFMADNYTHMMAAFDSRADAWDFGCFGIQQLL